MPDSISIAKHQETLLDMLKCLMDSNQIKQSGLVGTIGSQKVVSEVMNGKISISKSMATALTEQFASDAFLSSNERAD